MKLIKNEQSDYEIKHLSEICNLGYNAYLEGREAEGDSYFEQLKPSDGYIYVQAHCFLSQIYSFRREFDMALGCISDLLRHFPDHPRALRHASFIHTYREEYEEAGQFLAACHPDSFYRFNYHYQAACIFAGVGDYENSLLALSKSIESGRYYDYPYTQKLWDDPELSLLWEALPTIAESSSARRLLDEACWNDLIDAYNPEAPFDELDPGNLRSFSTDEMCFIQVHLRKGYIYANLMEELRLSDPLGYDILVHRLKAQRERSVRGLRESLCK